MELRRSEVPRYFEPKGKRPWSSKDGNNVLKALTSLMLQGNHDIIAVAEDNPPKDIYFLGAHESLGDSLEGPGLYLVSEPLLNEKLEGKAKELEGKVTKSIGERGITPDVIRVTFEGDTCYLHRGYYSNSPNLRDGPLHRPF